MVSGGQLHPLNRMTTFSECGLAMSATSGRSEDLPLPVREAGYKDEMVIAGLIGPTVQPVASGECGEATLTTSGLSELAERFFAIGAHNAC